LLERVGELDLPLERFYPPSGFFGSQVFLEQLRLVGLDRQ
jgi:hypothetical protein